MYISNKLTSIQITLSIERIALVWRPISILSLLILSLHIYVIHTTTVFLAHPHLLILRALVEVLIPILLYRVFTSRLIHIVKGN
jgi:hypothetical protein